MLTLTTPDDGTFTAETRIALAAVIADHRNGAGWENGLHPFFEQHEVWDIIEELALIEDGIFDGYTLTEH